MKTARQIGLTRELLIAGGIGFALALLMMRPPRRPPPRWRYDG